MSSRTEVLNQAGQVLSTVYYDDAGLVTTKANYDALNSAAATLASQIAAIKAGSVVTAQAIMLNPSANNFTATQTRQLLAALVLGVL